MPSRTLFPMDMCYTGVSRHSSRQYTGLSQGLKKWTSGGGSSRFLLLSSHIYQLTSISLGFRDTNLIQKNYDEKTTFYALASAGHYESIYIPGRYYGS